MTSPVRRKLIEVSIPLEAINAASAREKSIRHGHPSTLHLWCARRPLAACRASCGRRRVPSYVSHRHRPATCPLTLTSMISLPGFNGRMTLSELPPEPPPVATLRPLQSPCGSTPDKILAR
jgi:hypothetical protein